MPDYLDMRAEFDQPGRQGEPRGWMDICMHVQCSIHVETYVCIDGSGTRPIRAYEHEDSGRCILVGLLWG